MRRACVAIATGALLAFAIGSVFLSVTPLAVIGGAVWYLRRRARELAATASDRIS